MKTNLFTFLSCSQFTISQFHISLLQDVGPQIYLRAGFEVKALRGRNLQLQARHGGRTR